MSAIYHPHLHTYCLEPPSLSLPSSLTSKLSPKLSRNTHPSAYRLAASFPHNTQHLSFASLHHYLPLSLSLRSVWLRALFSFLFSVCMVWICFYAFCFARFSVGVSVCVRLCVCMCVFVCVCPICMYIPQSMKNWQVNICKWNYLLRISFIPCVSSVNSRIGNYLLLRLSFTHTPEELTWANCSDWEFLLLCFFIFWWGFASLMLIWSSYVQFWSTEYSIVIQIKTRSPWRRSGYRVKLRLQRSTILWGRKESCSSQCLIPLLSDRNERRLFL